MRTDRINIKAANRRHAVTMIEVISAMAVLATLIVVSAELLTLARAQRRGVVQRRTALVEAQNALERLTAVPLDTSQINAGFDGLALAPHTTRILPEGQIIAHAEPSDESGATDGYQLSVEVTWQLASGESAAPVRLTTWVYPSPAGPTTDAKTEVEP
jgi:hypothetical protein